jgi:hypothetical protein
VGEDAAVTAIDEFIVHHRFPDGTRLIDKFLASPAGRQLPASDRELLLGWSEDPVEGSFEVLKVDRKNGSLLLLNLYDDLKYRTYSTIGLKPLSHAGKGSFLVGRILPLTRGEEPGGQSWVISGNVAVLPKSSARDVAKMALGLMADYPHAVLRNPEKLKQAWESQRLDRERFIEYFGADDVVFPTAEVEEKLTAYYRHAQQAATAAVAPDGKRDERNQRAIAETGMSGGIRFKLPDDLRHTETIGVVYDETDGISLLADWAMAKALFENPKLAADKNHADLIRGYLRSEGVTPVPLERLAAVHPDTADEVFRRVLGKRNFTWAEHGEALLRKRKPWHYEEETLPQVTIVGDRLLELAAG